LSALNKDYVAPSYIAFTGYYATAIAFSNSTLFSSVVVHVTGNPFTFSADSKNLTEINIYLPSSSSIADPANVHPKDGNLTPSTPIYLSKNLPISFANNPSPVSGSATPSNSKSLGT